VKRVLTNDFSWSKSRHEKMSQCQRAYFFHYYGSWGGWEATAPKEVRQLYVLKKLHNRFTWAGAIVHSAIRDVLMASRHGRSLDPEQVMGRVHGVMRQDYAFSRGRGYWRDRHRKEFSGLVEHEYDEPVSPEEWRANWENVRSALGWFFQSRWVEVARSLAPKQWLELDLMDYERSIFHLDGVKVFAVPDFAYLDEDGAAMMVDWKTGRVREGYDEQVLGYAIYLSSRYGLSIDRIRAALVYLNEGVEQTVRIDGKSIEAFRESFTQSVAAMRGLLTEEAGNVPLPESFFSKTDELQLCQRCVFRRPCGKEKEIAEKEAQARRATLKADWPEP
jgi:hypothetical protein